MWVVLVQPPPRVRHDGVKEEPGPLSHCRHLLVKRAIVCRQSFVVGAFGVSHAANDVDDLLRLFMVSQTVAQFLDFEEGNEPD